MLAVAMTVLDGSDVSWSGRLARLAKSDKLDVLGKLVPEENIQRLEVQSAVSIPAHADSDDEVADTS